MQTLQGAVICDGADDLKGRAHLLISALNHAREALIGVPIRFLSVSDRSVSAAVELLRWDHGLDAEILSSDVRGVEEAGSDARLFCAIAYDDGHKNRLKTLAPVGVRQLIAVQFPTDFSSDSVALSLVRAAHDPKAYARRLVASLAL